MKTCEILGYYSSDLPEKTGKSLLYKVGGETHIPPPMIFAAINWLAISINLLLVVFVIVCLLMALLILMQRPKQEGLGAAFGGGVTDQVFGARTTNVLQKGTVYLGSMFFILSLTLAILIGKRTEQKSLLEPVAKEESVEKTGEKPAVEVVPEEQSIADELPTDTIPTEAVPESPANVPAKDAAEAAVDAVEEAVDAPEAPAAEESPAGENDVDESQ